MGGASFLSGVCVKPSLSVDAQVTLLSSRGLVIDDETICSGFFSRVNYYRFSGYARYFQVAPHQGDDRFTRGTTFAEILDIYYADEELRALLSRSLTAIELLLRTHFARVVGDQYGPYDRFLGQDFYTDAPNSTPTVDHCLGDIARSKDRHILRFRDNGSQRADYSQLPVWSAVEAWSFGTLSKAIERGASGALADEVASSIGVAKAGFAYRVRSLVYLRNRCAHHGRLWHHSVLDAGPTPNNVRSKAKRLVGQFEHRSVLDIVASLDDIAVRGKVAAPLLPNLASQHRERPFWDGLAKPQSPRDHAL